MTARPPHQEAAMKSQSPTRTSGFVVAVDEGQPFWFLNTLTITKVGSDQCHDQMSIVDHRVPPGFAPRRISTTTATKRCSSWTARSTGSAGTTDGGPGPARWYSCPARSRTASPSPTPDRAGSSSWPHPEASTSSSRRPAPGPGPVPARTRPARPGSPHATGRRPRHPDPAPARTVTTPRQASANLAARRRAVPPDLRASEADAKTASNAPRRLPGTPIDPDLRAFGWRHQETRGGPD